MRDFTYSLAVIVVILLLVQAAPKWDRNRRPQRVPVANHANATVLFFTFALATLVLALALSL